MRKDDGALSADYDSSSNGKVDLEKDDRQRKVSGYDDRRSDPFGMSLPLELLATLDSAD